MRTYTCACGNTLYYDNTRCGGCGREVGFCPVCDRLSPLEPGLGGGYRCGHAGCGAELVKCYNYEVEGVCNRCVAAEGGAGAGGPGGPGGPGGGSRTLCGYCRYNAVIPDLAKAGNLEKWRRIEAAKRRAFYQLDLLGLPHGTAGEGFEPPLSFEFKEDVPSPTGSGATGILGDHELVMTGHLNGTITINIREADPVERERLRVQFGEPHRSLIGHFRHELAHYYWDLLIKGRDEAEFARVFGDPHGTPYAEAMGRYYERGPAADWRERYASAYASMHPWEDFAETFTTYLEMVGTLDTAYHLGLGGEAGYPDLEGMVGAYRKLGVALNEVNRTMGLKDVLTRSIPEPVIEKLRYVHRTIQGASRVGGG